MTDRWFGLGFMAFGRVPWILDEDDMPRWRWQPPPAEPEPLPSVPSRYPSGLPQSKGTGFVWSALVNAIAQEKRLGLGVPKTGLNPTSACRTGCPQCEGEAA